MHNPYGRRQAVRSLDSYRVFLRLKCHHKKGFPLPSFPRKISANERAWNTIVAEVSRFESGYSYPNFLKHKFVPATNACLHFFCAHFCTRGCSGKPCRAKTCAACCGAATNGSRAAVWRNGFGTVRLAAKNPTCRVIVFPRNFCGGMCPKNRNRHFY